VHSDSAKAKNLRPCHACTCWQTGWVACYFKPGCGFGWPTTQPTVQPSATPLAAFWRGPGQRLVLVKHHFSIVAAGLEEWVCSCIWLRTTRTGWEPEPMGRLAWVWFE